VVVKQCFNCDGTGQLCDICGESSKACGCEPDEIDAHVAEYDEQYSVCPHCNGTGK
jgi:hypothetical protein